MENNSNIAGTSRPTEHSAQALSSRITDEMLAEREQMGLSQNWAVKYAAEIVKEYASAPSDLKLAANRLAASKQKHYKQALSEYLPLLRKHGYGYDLSVDDMYETLPTSCQTIDKIIRSLQGKHSDFERQRYQAEQYRDARKDSRFRVVGGGFGIGGAVQGMATAGAINLVTGMAHSVFNGIDGFLTNNSIDSNMSKTKAAFAQAIKAAAEDDIYRMIDVYFSMIHYSPFYSKANHHKALNIKKAIDGNEVRPEDLEEQVKEVLYYVPYDKELYPWALALIPSESEDLQRTAKMFGFDSTAEHLRQETLREEERRSFWGDDYDAICEKYKNNRDFNDIQDSLGDSVITIAGKIFSLNESIIDKYKLSFEAQETSNRCRKAMEKYQVLSSEIPLFFFEDSWFHDGSKGVLVTTQKLYCDEGMFELNNIREIKYKYSTDTLSVNNVELSIRHTGTTISVFADMLDLFIDIYKHLPQADSDYIQKTNAILLSKISGLNGLHSIYFNGRKNDIQQINKAIKNFSIELMPGEEGVCFIKNTWFHSASEGTIITSYGIYAKKNSAEKTHFMKFARNNCLKFLAENKSYIINETMPISLPYTESDCRIVGEYLEEIILAISHKDLSSNNQQSINKDNSGNPKENDALPEISSSFVQEANRRLLDSIPDLNDVLSISLRGRERDEKELRKAIKNFVGELKQGEESICFIDRTSSLFRSATEGTLITSAGIYDKTNSKEIPRFIAFEKNNEIKILPEKKSIEINEKMSISLDAYTIFKRDYSVIGEYLEKIISAISSGELPSLKTRT